MMMAFSLIVFIAPQAFEHIAVGLCQRYYAHRSRRLESVEPTLHAFPNATDPILSQVGIVSPTCNLHGIIVCKNAASLDRVRLQDEMCSFPSGKTALQAAAAIMK